MGNGTEINQLKCTHQRLLTYTLRILEQNTTTCNFAKLLLCALYLLQHPEKDISSSLHSTPTNLYCGCSSSDPHFLNWTIVLDSVSIFLSSVISTSPTCLYSDARDIFLPCKCNCDPSPASLLFPIFNRLDSL